MPSWIAKLLKLEFFYNNFSPEISSKVIPMNILSPSGHANAMQLKDIRERTTYLLRFEMMIFVPVLDPSRALSSAFSSSSNLNTE